MTARPLTRPVAAVSSHWWAILTVVLACGYLWIGTASPLPSIRWPTLTGGVLVLVALGLATRSRPAALTALIAGAVIPSITGWASVVVPVTGLLILLCGTPAIRSSTTAGRASEIR